MGSAKRRSSLRVSGIALLVLGVLSAAGCTTIDKQHGERIPKEQAVPEDGGTDVWQIVERLGPPTHISTLPGGLVMAYESVHVIERQIGINLEDIGLHWFKMAFGRGWAERETLVLAFDDNGVLRARESRDWTEDIGRGFGLQLFFVALPTVDTRHLSPRPVQLSWGRLALESLPVTLNVGQSLTSGSHGIEIQGTPISVGQHTLEMKTLERSRQR
jgi:hypothetical protein